MKHIARISTESPALAAIDWTNPDKGPGIAGFNELGDWVVFLASLAEGVLGPLLPTGVESVKVLPQE